MGIFNSLGDTYMVKKKHVDTPVKEYTKKTRVNFKPRHKEWNEGGPGHMIVTRKYTVKKHPAWYKPWELIPTLVNQHVVIHRRPKTAWNRYAERVQHHSEIKKDLESGSIFFVPNRPSALRDLFGIYKNGRKKKKKKKTEKTKK